MPLQDISLLPILGAAAGGAMSGASSFFGGKNVGEEYKYDYHPLDKQFKLASQALIPLYLKLITGGVPEFLKKYLNQAQSTALLQAQQAGQNYLREIGMKGMDFGPQQAAALSNIYQGVTPAVLGAMNSARMSMIPSVMEGMQSWSAMRPQQTATMKTQPSMKDQMLSGALGFGAGKMQGLMSAGPASPFSGIVPEVPSAKLGSNTVLGGGGDLLPIIRNILGGGK